MGDEPIPSNRSSWRKLVSLFSSWFPVIRRNQPASDLPPRPNPPLQQPVWVPDQVWDMPPRPRNLALEAALSGSQDPPLVYVPPDSTMDAREKEIRARLDDALRLANELTSTIARVRGVSTDREIGPRHNLGPPIDDLDDLEDLIALFKDEGSKVKTAIDAKPIVEQVEKAKRVPERIWGWLKAAGLLVGGVGLHKMTEDLTAPLWDELAHKLVEFCHAVEVWVSLLPLQ
jgi:hypothetical protein